MPSESRTAFFVFIPLWNLVLLDGGLGMKKILWYFVGSLALSLGLMLVDIIAGRVMFGRMGDMLADAGINNVGSGSVDLEAIGMCGDDKPLLLMTGVCVACDYSARENIDVLMGCEKCPNLEKRGIKCLFQIETDENAHRGIK